jgi:hypothetical protein
MVLIISHMNMIHILPSYFFTINLNVILPPSSLFQTLLPELNVDFSLVGPIRLVHLIFPDMNVLVIPRET